MKILTIIGARPQFIKASVVSKAIRLQGNAVEIVVHTGQHFDANMSDVFFTQLGLQAPRYELDIHGGSHGNMTGRMLMAIEDVILSEKPDRLMVYGDTNSTLAGALAAAKLHIPVAHVEAGLRSFNLQMPEEVNRILTDQLSDILLCPTDAAVDNLRAEGFDKKPVILVKVGDVMQDSALFFAQYAKPPAQMPNKIDSFALATLHRAENTDDLGRLRNIVTALNRIHSEIAPVLLPLHPRTQTAIDKIGVRLNMHVMAPVGYLEMIWLLQHCGLVLTDSGGVQKESFFFGKRCVTLRDQTEWVELVDLGVNELVGANTDLIVGAAMEGFGAEISDDNKLYGGGDAAGKVAVHVAGNAVRG